MSRRRRQATPTGLYDQLIERDRQFRDGMAACGFDLARAWPKSVPVESAPLTVYGWMLPSDVRRSLGIGVDDRVVVYADDTVTSEPAGEPPSLRMVD